MGTPTPRFRALAALARRRGLVTAAGTAACVVLGLLAARAAHGDAPRFRVVVNNANPVAIMSAEDVSDLLLKKSAAWEDGVAAEPVDQVASSPVREALSQAVHGRAVAAVKSYWQTQVFSGALAPPPEVADDAEVVSFVRSRRGGIGYVSAGAAVDGVRVVSLYLPPQRLTQVAPRYLPAAERMRIAGTVKLRVTVSTAGTVEDVQVLQELGGGLTEEATRAVRQWTYRPASRDGQPVEAKVDVALQFGR